MRIRLTLKDLYATITLAVVVTAYAVHLAGTSTWLLDTTRGTTGLLLVLGAVGCGFGNAADLYLEDRTPGTRAYTLLTGALGLTALAAAGYGLITASAAGPAVLVAAIAALWLVATVRHTMVPARRTVHQPDLHDVMERSR
jgi:hypothetical protein